MNTIQKIIKNVGLLFLSLILSYVFDFFTLIYSARYLGVVGFGIISSALALTSIFSVFIDLGFYTLTIRDVSCNKSLANEYISNIIPIKIILSLLVLTIIFIILNFSNYNKEIISVIFLITFYMVFNAFSMMFYSLFQAYEKMEYQSIGLILSNIILLAGILLIIHYKADIIKLASIYVLMGIIMLLYSYFIYYSKFKPIKGPNPRIVWKNLIKESWPFAITEISINLYLWIDTVLLSLIQGSEAVGLYNASYKLILVLLFIPLVFNSAIFPRMSKYYFSSEYVLKISFEKLFKIMMLLAIPLGVGTVLIANKVILLVYGEQFINATIVHANSNMVNCRFNFCKKSI